MRGKQALADPSPNAFWDNRSFRAYADYALTEGFRRGLERLRQLGDEKRCAIMCAEAVWWRCHRRIIADYLIAAGASVSHPGARQDRAGELTKAARALPGGGLVYDPAMRA